MWYGHENKNFPGEIFESIFRTNRSDASSYNTNY